MRCLQATLLALNRKERLAFIFGEIFQVSSKDIIEHDAEASPQLSIHYTYRPRLPDVEQPKKREARHNIHPA